MNIEKRNNKLLLTGTECFTLDETLDCGQAFRFTKNGDGIWEGVAFGKILRVSQDADGNITFHDGCGDDFETLWRTYFDLDTDYIRIAGILSENEVLSRVYNNAVGIRIMRQEPFETLCSFIISQNNNIPRIKGIISKLCENFGDEIAPGYYTFPTAERLAALSEENLAPLRAGFRNRYILSAAQMVAGGSIDLESLRTAPMAEARAELKRICGVGDKVAECTLLFGLGRMEAFPIDVWMKRIMAELLPDGLPDFALPYAGIAQQYLFHYARLNRIGVKKV